MKPLERTNAFFATMLITFGITGLDFDHPEFKFNELPYIALSAGLILAIIFIVKRTRR